MPRLTLHKTSFTSGEISPRLLGRGDLSAYENGAAKLRNIFVHPTGGISRRGGLPVSLDTDCAWAKPIRFSEATKTWLAERTPWPDHLRADLIKIAKHNEK